MTTWTCKGLLAGAACLALAGCDDFPGLAPSASQALTSAQLGRVMLVPPTGYCVDKRSLRQSFALMARCDTLGGDASGGAPLALITATTAPAVGGVRADDLGNGQETVLSRSDTDTLSLIQVRGTPPNARLRDVYWRAAGRVGDQVVGLAIYEAAQGANLGTLAPDMLKQTMQRTQDQSAAIQPAQQDNSATTPTKRSGNGFLAGLFE
ncbi:hypothetical protein [Tateyamaria sp. SN3-11]|uniref:hypothetical protein n=1 Tax=Tateyamaria sp. SN3-11 TaxID=3092147 RepID=UPI0039E82D17